MLSPFLTTGIGSLPHAAPSEACRLILESVDIPFWPQLPTVSFREFMIPQFSEGMPLLVIDERKESLWIREDGDELSRFYETATGDLKLPLSEKYAAGLHAFLKAVEGRRFPRVKGQCTGPLSFTLGLKNFRGKPIYFDEELREISLMILQAKIRWQIDVLRPYADEVIIFIDEPVLSALGSSSYLGVSSDEALRLLKTTADSITEGGALSGIHCCSKADWPLVIDSGVDIVSFDAYDYIDTLSLYPREFSEFLRRGGYLAWGIVPTTEAIGGEDAGSIIGRFDRGLDLLSRSLPSDLLLSQTMLTPSCGTGSRTIPETEKIFRILSELGATLKGRFA